MMLANFLGVFTTGVGGVRSGGSMEWWDGEKW